MEKFVDFASGKWGRLMRILVGATLGLLAFVSVEGVAMWVLAVVGVVLILSGLLKMCILNKLVGRSISSHPN